MRWLFPPILILISTLVSGQNLSPFVMVLGVTQDGGYPHIGCDKGCCKTAFNIDSSRQFVTSLALVDPAQKKWWLFEATPDVVDQLQMMQSVTKHQFRYLPDGIFITHAHIGHYTGLMYLGREALGSKNIPVYVLPRMAEFLSGNGPWSQLVKLENIKIQILQPNESLDLSDAVSVEPLLVPHRDEYSETAGFRITTSFRKYLFIPDIDKWKNWSRDLVNEVKAVDVAFLDATFYNKDELPGRDINEVPHPLVIETMSMFSDPKQKSKINFIHFNHTNPILWSEKNRVEFLKSGFRLSKMGEIY